MRERVDARRHIHRLVDLEVLSLQVVADQAAHLMVVLDYQHTTPFAEAGDPVRMARAMKAAVEAGRHAYLAGRMAKKLYADPSSPLAGLI